MRRNFDQPILDLWDKPIRPMDATGKYIEDSPPLTLAVVACNALLAVLEDERSLTGKEKAERLAIALKINAKPKEVDLTVEQLAKVKELIGKACTTLICGRAYELLEMEPKAVAAGAAEG